MKTKIVPSIIEKNLEPGEDSAKRKIFIYNLVDSSKKEYDEENGTIVTPVLKLSQEKSNEIMKSLNFTQSQIKRFNNQKIYITPFSNDLSIALTFLKGEMVNRNLVVTKERADLVIGTLCLEIDSKSEILINGKNDSVRKEINSEFLKEIFVNVQQKELFEEILEKLPYNAIKKRKIKFEKTKIIFSYQNIKERLKKNFDYNQLLNVTEEEIVTTFSNKIKSLDPTISNEELIIAISIDCFCELGGEIA